MNIQFNDEPLACADGVTLKALMANLNQEASGSALAVNNILIPREQWRSHTLCEGDNVLLFQAIAGG